MQVQRLCFLLNNMFLLQINVIKTMNFCQQFLSYSMTIFNKYSFFYIILNESILFVSYFNFSYYFGGFLKNKFLPLTDKFQYKKCLN